MPPADAANDFVTLILQSPHGPVRVMASRKGIARLEFCPKKSAFKNSTDAAAKVPVAWIHEIRRRLEGKAPSARLPLDPHGTPFQKTVWKALCQIPRGQVRSYQNIAKAVGKPRAARAVASACASNRIGILIPCHRVIRKDGTLSGYYWGSKLKRRLLENEGVLLPLSIP